MNEAGAPGESFSPGRCPVAQQPGPQPVTASSSINMTRNKETEWQWNGI